jgi:hypothetical protein
LKSELFSIHLRRRWQVPSRFALPPEVASVGLVATTRRVR